MDILHGFFTTYEMRIEQENPDIKEASFKASKKSKKREGKKKNITIAVTSQKMMKKWPTLSK
jgi:hypothetical protein